MRIELENGKYTYISHEKGGQEVLRNGGPWRDLTGDKFIYCLAARLEAAEKEVAILNDRILVMDGAGQEQAAQIEALKADAEQYRWLREHDATGLKIFQNCRTPIEIDAAIDAARKGVKP